ncbi:MAG: hypothetical protein [Wendovervirus sonii]|uniref:Uncharacterized protein n=1 Tax=phage Lak_Megaphage_Sonny TaxID=3109229 RepID=A0ABZ0Z321_9CAUD|nr:MAG: hypothetical protein [phage Lak_Megaphage_Sonny]
MEKSTKENKVDAFVENVGFAADAAREAINNISEQASDFINEVCESETYANIKEETSEIAEKLVSAGKAAGNVARAFIKSKLS